MIHKIKKIVEQLSEQEAKSLLFQQFLRIQMLEETSYSEDQFLKDMKKEYHSILQVVSKPKQTNYNKIHIVFGDSAAGSLKMALPKDEKVIRFSDLFSIGPVNQLHNEEGLEQRRKWLFLHINIDEQRTFNYIEEFQQMVVDIKNIPEHLPIVIWTANNAHEQTAARFVLHLLKEKKNDIRLINISAAYQSLWPNIIPVHTGELAADKLKIIYETYKNEPITEQIRYMLADEWDKLAETTEVLRIWEDDQIKNVEVNYFDKFIIEKARYLHKELGKNDFIKSARIIGEVLGHSDQYVGDAFLEYRVLQLILQGIFEIEGVPKAMRFYSVRLKEVF